MARAAALNVFLAVQCIEGDDGASRDAEFGKKRLRRQDLVGLLGDFDMSEHEGGVGGERAQHLGGGAVMDVVDTAAERLAVQRDAALSGQTLGRRRGPSGRPGNPRTP